MDLAALEIFRTVAEHDAAVIIWTSGTTGVPKGAWFDHRGLFAAVASAGVMSAPYDVKLASTPCITMPPVPPFPPRARSSGRSNDGQARPPAATAVA